MRLLAPAVVALALLVGAGCHKAPREYDTEVEITRVEVVHVDDKGAPTSVDVEFVWAACGQRESIRGGKDFAACITAKKPGTRVPARVLHHWDAQGFYDWDPIDVGGCKRPPEDADNASFDTVQECGPTKDHGAVTGFRCNRLPEAELLAKCPWFRRH